MTVEFDPKSQDCFSFGAPNGHWFSLLKVDEISSLLGNPALTNDPLDVSDETAKSLANVLREKQMELAIPSNLDLGMYIEFFDNCQGFTTY